MSAPSNPPGVRRGPRPRTGPRAFRVGAAGAEASVLVFARGPSQAKWLGRATEWLQGEDWIDLRATREPAADGFADGPAVLDGADARSQRIMRGLGWFEVDGDGTPCDRCGLYPWQALPESLLVEDGGLLLCAGCRAPGGGRGR